MKELIKLGLITSTLAVGIHFCEPANAQSAIPFNEGISNRDAFSGPTWSVNGLTPSTELHIEASGFFDLFTIGTYRTNAAGVLLPTTTSPGQIFPAVDATLGNGTPFGALLIGNSSLGYVPVFAPTPGNGLGSSTPPTTLSTQVTWGTLFPALSTPFTGSLQWRVNDSSPNDNPNVETMLVNASINSPTAVPTPALLPGLIGMGAAALRKHKQEVAPET